MGRIKGKHSILHHHLLIFEAFETGPILLSEYICLVKWHSAASAAATQLCITVQPLKYKSYFPLWTFA